MRLSHPLFSLVLLVGLAGCGSDDTARDPSQADSVATAASGVPRSTVTDVAQANGELSGFARLVEAAGLGATLADTSRVLTVFAPSNVALAAVPGGVEALAARPDLRDLLLAHVLPTQLFSTDALGTLTLDALDGGSLTVESGDGTVSVSRGGTRAQVITPDLDAENGVVHVIDAVLLP